MKKPERVNVSYPHGVQVAERFVWEIILTHKWDYLFNWDEAQRFTILGDEFFVAHVEWEAHGYNNVQEAIWRQQGKKAPPLGQLRTKAIRIDSLVFSEKGQHHPRFEVIIFGRGKEWKVQSVTITKLFPGDDIRLVGVREVAKATIAA